MNRNVWTWSAVLAGLLAAGLGLGALLRAQGYAATGNAVAVVGALIAAGWVVRGLWLWRDVTWVSRAAWAILATLAAALLYGFCRLFGFTGAAFAVLGAYGMGMSFALGLLAVRLVLSPGFPVLGVARTLVDEAIRMKVPLVFIGVVVVTVPVLPLVLDPADRLDYRIQSFLTWSLIATGVLLSLMTLFLAVGTITGEVERRQIYLTLTKPVSRGRYLLGKWLGIVALNAVLVTVAGAGIYTFTLYLAQQPAQGPLDRAAVDEQVLVARQTADPRPSDETDLSQQLMQRLEAVRAEGLEPDRYGLPGDPLDRAGEAERTALFQQVLSRWMSIGPRSSATYVFRGLGDAKDFGPTVQLRLEPNAAGSTSDGMVRLNMRLNGRPFPVPPLAESNFHVLDLPSEAINDRGELVIEIANPVVNGQEQPSISFNTTDGLQVLYRVGSFEPNFARAMVLMWVRLAFLAMLGLAAGSFLGFPVASLLCLLVYVAASSSGFINESLSSYASVSGETQSVGQWVAVPLRVAGQVGEGEVGDAIRTVIGSVGGLFMLLIPSLSTYDAVNNITDGRLVPTRVVGEAVLWVGVVWTGLVAAIGWWVFRNRELAAVTV